MITAAAITLFALTTLAAIHSPGLAWAMGRTKRRVRRARHTYTNWTTYKPPVPTVPRDDDADWFSSWPADTPISVIERAYYDKEFAAIPEVAEDLRSAS